MGGGLGVTSPDEDGFSSDSGFRLFGGYGLGENFAVEVGYADLGSFDAEAQLLADLERGLISEFSSFGDIGVSNLSTGVEVSGFTMDVIGILPLSEQFSLFAKIGVFLADTTIPVSGTLSLNGVTEKFSDKVEDSSTEMSFGFGADYAITEAVKVGLEYTVYQAGDADVSFVGGTLSYSF